MTTCYTVIIALLVAAFLSLTRRKLPPGPTKIPVIGSLHQLSREYPWKQMQEWHKVYGPIITIQAGQIVLIVLGSHKVAKELLSKRGSIYSSRPRLVVAQECFAKGFGSALLPYGPTWKRNHKVQMSLLSPRRCELYRPIQELESCQLLFNLLSSNDFHHEMHRYSSSLIFTLLYGKRFITGRESELEEIESLSTSIVQAVSFGNWAVDTFPILNYLPRTLAKWKKVGDDFHERLTALYTVNAAFALSTPTWNWTKEMMKNFDHDASPKELEFVLGEIFEAGSHTTSGALEVSVLACASNPDCMERAQEELDTIIGCSRLPTFEDIPNLPYVQAFVSEILRWRPLAPGGVPHAPIHDDTYAGFHIPKGAAVVANHWSLDMDKEVFEKPDEFMPKRWLANPDLPVAAFGFGRRTCPGQHLARSSLLLVVSRLLWAYDIRWKSGQDVQLESLEMTHEGIFSKPCRFEAEFVVRSALHEDTLRSSWAKSDRNVEDVLNAISARF